MERSGQIFDILPEPRDQLAVHEESTYGMATGLKIVGGSHVRGQQTRPLVAPPLDPLVGSFESILSPFPSQYRLPQIHLIPQLVSVFVPRCKTFQQGQPQDPLATSTRFLHFDIRFALYVSARDSPASACRYLQEAESMMPSSCWVAARPEPFKYAAGASLVVPLKGFLEGFILESSHRIVLKFPSRFKSSTESAPIGGISLLECCRRFPL